MKTLKSSWPGRCISATHVAASAGKSMGSCVATGHAAGIAAAMAAKKGCTPREVKVSQIQDALRAEGGGERGGGSGGARAVFLSF
ncbi:MAG: FAD-dependent oxidoreductase [Planctomycetes bacterium]|nr:FAD-dependent oxidoreductase [Planctomycetota bacterium]